MYTFIYFMVRAIPEIIVWEGRKAVKLKFDSWWVFLMSSLIFYVMSDFIKMDAWWVQK